MGAEAKEIEIGTAVRPKHYKMNINGNECQVKDLIKALIGEDGYKNFCLGNAVKYIFRHEKKNGIQDIEKAVYYLNDYVDICSNKED